jgi:hypothetical protein
MDIQLLPIMGMHVGFEFYETEHNKDNIQYLLIDFLILRIQIAWWKE